MRGFAIVWPLKHKVSRIPDMGGTGFARPSGGSCPGQREPDGFYHIQGTSWPRLRQARRISVPVVLAMVLSACVPRAPPAREAAVGTPAARVAAESFAAVLDPAGGAPLGAAVAFESRRAFTSAHVARAAAFKGRLRLQHGDGRGEADAPISWISDRVDIALLDLPADFLKPATVATVAPATGDSVWAVGPHRLGRPIASGQVLQPPTATGAGFTARIPVLMGYSGGPVVDREGRLIGLTTSALDETLGAYLVALVAGMDAVGLVFGVQRQVFVLGIGTATDEVRRLAGNRPTVPALAGARRSR